MARRTRTTGMRLGFALVNGMVPRGRVDIAPDPGQMARAGSVDARFQSFNVAMVEVTAGRFRAPYNAANK